VAVQDNIVLGEIEIRPHERTVLAKGQEVPLTTAEFDIVMMLAEHPGWVYSADQISGDAYDAEMSPESVSVLVSRLRRRLAEAGLPDVIETVRGFGYRLHPMRGLAGEEPPADAETCALRDAAWQLQETVIRLEHAGTPEQKCTATETLDSASRAIRSVMGE